MPKIEALTIAGRLTIAAAANDTIESGDFLNYELTAQFPVGEEATPEILQFKFDPDVQVQDRGAAFAFADTAIFRGSVRDLVLVKVSARDGSVPWSRSFKADDPALAQLAIVVPLLRSATVAKSTYVIDKSKRLRGQVLELSKKCPLRGIGVVIQAKTANDAAWKVVAAGATDQSGNFSVSYPYGSFTAARAILSVTTDDPAEVAIKSYKNPKQTIADDFLYLLAKEFACPHAETGEDCDCHKPKKAGRLPDYADLIESDEYTQDIGGACVNLSTPNRTLSEFNYQAIVRTSDPEVSNYTLTKTEVVTTGIDAAIQIEFLRGASELIDAISIPQLAAVFTPDAIATAKANASALVGVSTRSTEPEIKAAIGKLSGVIERFNVVSTPAFDALMPMLMSIVEIARRLKAMLLTALGSRTETRYELVGGNSLLNRRKVGLNNPIRWQDAPEAKSNLSLYQAVSVATGHLLHYKALLKADGYSLGDLIYSLPLAPGQKKEIVVYDMSHTLTGGESQALSQGERLSAAIVDERDIATQLGGRISESMRGNSTANTSGISFGLGTGGSGSGSTGAYGGSGSAVIGVAGGFANANSNAASDSSRDVSQFFGEKLRQSIMQNAEGYRQLNASVVTTVQEGQRYSVTSEVIANHNHCHALTMMYFEVLRHYAIFQELSSVEECVFVPLLMTEFTTQNIHKWRDVLAASLLPIPSNTYLPAPVTAGGRYAHPLVRAFDANERIKTRYENVDFPVGSFDEEPLRSIRGSMRLRVSLPRPRTRFDRILSLPVTTQTITTREFDPEATALSALEFPRKVAEYSAKVAATAGLYALFNPPPPPPSAQYSVQQQQILVREAIFDACMSLDANFQTARPADCIRITNFKPPATIGTIFGPLAITSPKPLDFFADNEQDKEQWQAYSKLLGYDDPLKMLEVYFKGNLISEWDDIFNNDVAPLIFEQIVQNIRLSDIAVDFSSESKYRGGERLMRLNVTGNTTKQRNQLPAQLRMSVNNQTIKSMQSFVTLNIEDVKLTYSTTHFEGTLFSGVINDDLLDDTTLYVPESADEKRNPRKEDAYLVCKLIDHLNSNLEHYNKALWYNLDPDRRYMLLDGFNIEVWNELDEPLKPRSLASIVKNELIAITGNSMVFPVAAGCRVDRSVIIVQGETDGEFEKITLLDHYKPLTPIEPYRISVPSKGVFAEAVQGACNACERIETERLQDWTKFPNTDEPTAIAPVTTPTPVVTDWKAAFKDFAPPLVSIQNAPAAPAPGAGLAGLSDLLGKSGVFKDITGLEGNQQNVMRTYLSNQENAKAFAEMAKEMAMQSHNTQNAGKIMDSLKTAKDTGALDQADYTKLVKDHLQQQIDGGATKKAELEKDKQSKPSPLTKAAVDAAGQGKDVKAQTTDSDGKTESVDISELGGETSHGLRRVFEEWIAATAMGVTIPFKNDDIEKKLIDKAKEFGFTLSGDGAEALREEMTFNETMELDKDKTVVSDAKKLEILNTIALRVVADPGIGASVKKELKVIITAVATGAIITEVKGFGFPLSDPAATALTKAMTDADITKLQKTSTTKAQKLALLKAIAARAIAAASDQSVKDELQPLVAP